MNKFFRNIRSYIESITDQDKGKAIFYPERIWRRIISIFIVVNIVIAGWGFYLFSQISNNNIFLTDTGAKDQAGALSREKLEKALIYLDAKQAKFNELLKAPPRVVDPSR